MTGVIPKRYVYVISESNDGPCKIGSSHYPDGRLAAFQAGNPRVLTLAFAKPIAFATYIELKVHHHFSHARLAGEWFSISVCEARSFIESIGTEHPVEEYARAINGSDGMSSRCFDIWSLGYSMQNELGHSLRLREIAERLRCSRQNIHQAIGILRAAGAVTSENRKPGTLTFARPPESTT